MRSTWIAFPLLFVLVVGCSKSSTGPTACGTAGLAALPKDVETIKWDNGTPSADGTLRQQNFDITVGNENFPLKSEPLFEGVRFDIAQPATIYGFSVQWGNLAAVQNTPSATLEAGLYPDFGYNGFDFWKTPVWQGTRCVADLSSNGTVDYVLDTPYQVAQPGLIYVAHDTTAGSGPAFTFDTENYSNVGDCENFAQCHSVVDLNEALANDYFTGISLSFPLNYIVRLFVKYAPAVSSSNGIFQPVPGPSLGVNVAWGDYDGDGYDDLITRSGDDELVGAPLLYHNNGNGTFTDVTAASGIAAMGLTGSGVWGDYDNDGCPDLFIFTRQIQNTPNSLLHNNCDGTFTNVTATAGLTGDLLIDPCPVSEGLVNHPQSTAAAWVDLDGDGWLDLIVTNYNCGLGLADFPTDVYHNNHDGTFSDWSATHGFGPPLALAGFGTSAYGANPIDLFNDGMMDVMVNDYDLQPSLFYKNGVGGTDGQFEEIASHVGLNGTPHLFQGAVYYAHDLGTVWGDLNNDGFFDLVQANLAHPRFYNFSDKSRVDLNDGTNHFYDNSGNWETPVDPPNGIRYQETYTSPVLGDFDNDGNLDLSLSARNDRGTYTNGSPLDARPTDFYWGNGDGTFTLDNTHAQVSTLNGWGMAASDFNNDGFLGLATTTTLFRNTLATRLTDHAVTGRWPGNWMEVRPVGGVHSNRSAIGATVRLFGGGRSFVGYVEGGNGQGCQDSMNVHFGLGNVISVDRIEVLYPAAGGGVTMKYEGPFASNQRIWVYESGKVHSGWTGSP